MAAKSGANSKTTKRKSKASTRVLRVAAKQRGAKTTPRRAVKRTIKWREPAGPSVRIKAAKPSAEHPLPEPIATFTF